VYWTELNRIRLKKTIRFGKSNGIKIFLSESDCSVHLQKLSVTHISALTLRGSQIDSTYANYNLSLTAACYATRGWTVSINHSLNNDDGLNPVQLKSETTTSPDSSVLQHKRDICHTQFWGTQWASVIYIGNTFLSTGIYTCYPTWEVQWRERDAAWQHWMWEIITWTIIWHIAVQGHPRSSTLVPIKSADATDTQTQTTVAEQTQSLSNIQLKLHYKTQLFIITWDSWLAWTKP